MQQRALCAHIQHYEKNYVAPKELMSLISKLIVVLDYILDMVLHV